MIVGIGVVFVVAGVVIILSRRRGPEPAPELPPDLPAPAEVVWIPTAPRRRRPDSYGALAPGTLEDRAPRR